MTPFFKEPLGRLLQHKRLSPVSGRVFSGLNLITGNKSQLNISNRQPVAYFQPSQTSWMELFLQKQFTAETAIIRSSRLVLFCKKGVLTNFEKFSRKHLRQSLAFNEAADLQSLSLSKKEIPTKMFSCEICEISHNTFFKEPKKLSISAKKTPLQMLDQVLNTPL